MASSVALRIVFIRNDVQIHRGGAVCVFGAGAGDDGNMGTEFVAAPDDGDAGAGGGDVGCGGNVTAGGLGGTNGANAPALPAPVLLSVPDENSATSASGRTMLRTMRGVISSTISVFVLLSA